MTSLTLRDLGFLAGRPAVSFTPADVNPYAWLDASDGLVTSGGNISSWTIKSGAFGGSLARSNPSSNPGITVGSLNNKSVAVFPGSGGFSYPSAYGWGLKASLTVYAVVSVNNYLSNYPGQGVLHSGCAYGNYIGFGGGTVEFGAAGYSGYASTSMPSAGPHIIVCGRSNNTTGFAGINGNPIVTNTSLPANAGANCSLLGYHSDGGALNGYVAELIWIQAYDAGAATSKITGYLAHKWGLQGNLPANHPYKTSPPLS